MAVDTDHRLKAGTFSQYNIENDAAAIVEDWARQSDQPTAINWMMIGAAVPTEGEFVGGLDGQAAVYGGASGSIEFFQLTFGMVNYLWTNILQSKFTNSVTLRIWHPQRGWTVYNAVLHWPEQWPEAGVQQARDLWSNMRLDYTRAVVAAYGRSYSAEYSSEYA